MDDFDYDYETAPLIAGDEVPRVRPRRQRAFAATDGESGWAEEVLRLLERPAWHRLASCAGLDPNLYFPVRGEPTKDARAVCATCPVRPECREAGMKEQQGLWGGLSARERRLLRRGAA